jgi:predicted DNA-binding WGR domain protein
MDDGPALTLYRIDRRRNMARFYTLSIEPTLFGDLSLTRRWGRIGTAGRQMIELHADPQTAANALHRKVREKRRLGYR